MSAASPSAEVRSATMPVSEVGREVNGDCVCLVKVDGLSRVDTVVVGVVYAKTE
jgi:hypothetical protein